jgi:hypothetical protein
VIPAAPGPIARTDTASSPKGEAATS